MKFFNIDTHISVIADLKYIFTELGHKVDFWSLSGHRWVFNLPPCTSPIINESNWQQINEQMVDKFFVTHYKDLDRYDAFISSNLPIFLKLFEKFKKPIIVVAGTRYDFPVIDDADRLAWLEDSLNNNQNLILVANNEFDKRYSEKFLKRKWQHISSLCLYTNEKYCPTDYRRVVFSKRVMFSKLPVQSIQDTVHQSQLGRYTWKQLYSYRDIIHFPYNVSTMSLFEQSSAGVQILMPSMKFCRELLDQGVPLFSEITFPNNDPKRSRHQFLSEDWLKSCDFYNGVINVHYFDSIRELNAKQGDGRPTLSTDNKDRVYASWKKILKQL